MNKGEKHHNLHHWNCRNPGGHKPDIPKSKAGGGYPHQQEFDHQNILRLKGKGKHHE